MGSASLAYNRFHTSFHRLRRVEESVNVIMCQRYLKSSYLIFYSRRFAAWIIL